MELKKIVEELKIDIFGTFETKLSKDKYFLFRQSFDDEWDTITTMGDEDGVKRSSILVGWKKNPWKRNLKLSPRECGGIHIRLICSLW